MIRRSLSTIALALLLASCGAKPVPYTAERFQLSAPDTWTIAEPPIKDVVLPPETKLALLKKDARGGNAIITVSERLLQAEEIARFAEASIAVARTMRGFVEESVDSAAIGDANVELLRFAAQPPDRTSVERFAFLALTANGYGYSLLARFPPGVDEDTEDEAIEAMLSFLPRTASASSPAQ